MSRNVRSQWLPCVLLYCHGVLALGWSGPGTLAAAEVESSPLPAAGTALAGRFVRVPSSESGLDFRYRWTPPPQYEHELVNGVTGGGICAGDYDGDGLVDLFLTQPFGGCRLYRNLGDLRFRDVTEEAGLIHEDQWGTGASFADIDGDGDLDLFVCGYDCPNRLYVNRGDGTFEEKAAPAGLDYKGASVMMAFADYDLDGDLDGYLTTNHIAPQTPPLWKYEVRQSDGMPILPKELEGIAKVLYRPDIRQGKLIPAGESDRLYRNDGNGVFTDVSREAGIGDQDFGLAATWWDFDRDGYPDLYNANDFYGADHFYRNNGDGTFTEINRESLPHTPWFSMGTDVADINNDGWLDFMASDMLGTTHFKEKLSMGDMQGWFLETAVPRQYMRNALYLNTGTFRFREIAHLAGVASTDWTWTLRFGDLDCDGWEDLYVTNGAERYWDDSDLMDSARGSQRIDTPQLKEVWLPSPVRNDPNLAFRNGGNLQMENVGLTWGLQEDMVSYGAVLVDLDNDGDLDVVSNNFEGEAALYRNELIAGTRALVELRMKEGNRHAIGAFLRVRAGDLTPSRYLTLSRGYMSGADPRVHFGLGRAEVFDLEIIWPNGRREELRDLAANRSYRITAGPGEPYQLAEAQPLFVPSRALEGAGTVEKPFDDYARQPLLPHRLSQLGPGLAWADVDGDGDLDFYIGRPSGTAGSLFLHSDNGFRETRFPCFEEDAACEDMAPLFLDVDGDGDADLFVVSGGVECEPGDAVLRDRLYINDGNGFFSRAPEESLPDLRHSGGPAAAADFDRDGDLDLFVGGRVTPGRYPQTPGSVLLRNDGGRFVDVTAELAPDLATAGMITAAIWSDADNDGWIDLLLGVEWGPVRLFRNDQGILREITEAAGLEEISGWWNSLAAGDIDNDGDIDYAVGNFGLNTKYDASPEKPARIYYGDFDGSGRPQIIEAKFSGSTLLPVRGKSCSQRAMPVLEKNFPTFRSFASATLTEIYTDAALANAERFEATELRSVLLRNDGRGRFTVEALPMETQVSPVFGLRFSDSDCDGFLDLTMVQNFYGPQPETGHMDGGVGLYLRGDGQGGLEPVFPRDSGFVLPGDGKALTSVDLNGDGWADWVTTANSGPVAVYLNQRLGGRGTPYVIRLESRNRGGNAVGAKAHFRTEQGLVQTAELYAGGGYLSQDPAELRFSVPTGDKARDVVVRWPDGSRSRSSLVDAGPRVTVSQPAPEPRR